jgi:hypothetical protein
MHGTKFEHAADFRVVKAFPFAFGAAFAAALAIACISNPVSNPIGALEGLGISGMAGTPCMDGMLGMPGKAAPPSGPKLATIAASGETCGDVNMSLHHLGESANIFTVHPCRNPGGSCSHA